MAYAGIPPVDASAPAPLNVEVRSIDYVPRSERHGKPWHLVDRRLGRVGAHHRHRADARVVQGGPDVDGLPASDRLPGDVQRLTRMVVCAMPSNPPSRRGSGAQ